MNVSEEGPVVVGVDGSDEGLRAVRYAVREAQRAGCGLRLVHAAPETVPMAPMLPLVSVETIDRVSHRIVNEAKQLAYDLTDGDLEVEKVIKSGSRVRVLVDASEDARMVVLGHRDRSLLGRVFTHSTCTGVAARATCPVVGIPAAGWTFGTEHGRVVVGVEGPAHAQEALAVAFAAASERHAKLAVVHAWKMQSPYDDLIAARVSDEEWIRSAKQMLEEILGDWREAYPEVEVEIDVRHEYTASALVQATEHADLLMLGRRGGTAVGGLFLGSTVRTLIREALCPVVVAPPRPGHDALPSRRLMTEDEVEPQA